MIEGSTVHENGGGTPQQKEGSPEDHQHDQHCQDGIDPTPAGEADGHHGKHHGHIDQAVAQSMKIGAAQIEIIFPAGIFGWQQHEGRSQVQKQPQSRKGNGPANLDGHRVMKPLPGFP